MSNEQTWIEAMAEVRPVMERLHQAREEALAQARKLIQTASKSIRFCHRRQFDEAQRLLDEAKALAAHARSAADDSPEILYAGYLQDAEKELVEAAAVLAMALGQPVPTAAQLQVQAASYLHGMGEAASEIRRYVLDEVRAGNMAEAERLLGIMEAVYESLIGFDFPDGLTGGLRRTTDALRAVLERTRSDVTATSIQVELIQALRNAGPEEK